MQPIPITLIAGFLGAGKTTLLNRVLSADHGKRVAVLVNDFGEINIDAELLAAAGSDDVVSLPNGCICCTLARDLVKAVQNVLAASPPPEHIIIEASGVSSPDEIAALLNVPELDDDVTIHGIITLVDAVNYRRLKGIVTFAERQIRSADLVLVNKIDLVDDDELENLVAELQETAPDASLLRVEYSQVPFDLLFEPLNLPAGSNTMHHHHTDMHHDAQYNTATVTFSRPLDRDALHRALDTLPSGIYRTKGILYFSDDPDHLHILQGVGGRYTITSGTAEDKYGTGSRIVFIGEPGSVNQSQLTQQFANCQQES